MPPAEVPDFDSMSPEEVMAWMESLAKRQGAHEGFLTDANMDIAEIDPSSVEIDEPGYVPFGEETRKPAPKKMPPPPAPEATKTEPVPDIQAELLPHFEEPEDEDTAIETSGLAWLESLAADQLGGFPQMDLEALSAELSELEPESEPELEAAPTNPLDWLESLTETQAEVEVEDQAREEAVEIEAPTPAPTLQRPSAAAETEIDIASITDPLAAGIDPMLWLESLAKRQGAKAEEFTTKADMDIPMPEDAVDTGPGYEAFSVENENRDHIASRKARETVDPTAWLESMAAGTAAEDEAENAMSDEEIRAALAKGTDIPPDQMEQFFARQLERGLTTEEEPLPDEEEFDQDAPPIPADLPDWLLEQVQPPDDTMPEPLPEDHQPVLLDEIMEPPSIQDLPDWLKADEQQDLDLELDSIFDTADTVPEGAEELEFYSSDPWVQAFEEEATSDPNEVPEWYERNLRDPARLAAVEQQMGQSVELDDADLPPETRLTRGEAEPVPAWIESDRAPEEAAAVELDDWLSEADVSIEPEEIPDWLAAADVEVAPEEIPDWLRDTMETDEAVDEGLIISPAEMEVPPEPEPEPEPQPAAMAIPPAAPPKAPPVPIPAPAADVVATLQNARTKVSSGDLEASLLDYESIIRTNTGLEDVVTDLTQLAEDHKDQPAVYRVLGDGLMRQGRLQDALDTYRKALNQL